MMTATTPDDATATEHPKLIRTYRTRAYLSGAGHVRLDDVLAQQCLLYNAALEERKTAWKGQHRERYLFRRAEPVAYSDTQATSRTLKDRSTGAYKTPLSKDSTERSRRSTAVSGRARPQDTRVSSLPGAGRLSRCIPVMPDVCSLMRARVRVWCVNIKGSAKVLRFKDKRVPPGIQPLQILVSRRPNGVYLCFVFDHLEAQLPVEDVKNPVGINAGRGGVRWGFSDGTTVERRRVDNKGRRRIQRKVARQKLGSKSRQKTVAQLAKHTHREKIRNRNDLHRITAQLVR